MRIILFIFLICFLLTASCKNEKEQQPVEETQEQLDARTISQSDIASIRYTEFELSQDAYKAVIDWQKFQELETQVDLIKKGDLNFFKGERLIVKTFFSEFRTEMPVALQTKEILARITALDTKAQKLNSLLTISNIDKSDQLKAIKEFLITVSNLKLQINKKLEFEKNNIQKPE
ncbi:hypothetical protein ACU8DI_03145 [Psychroserpens sp. BH13MA-6]